MLCVIIPDIVSIERFFESYPPGPEMAHQIKSEKNNLGRLGSLVPFFAMKLVDEAVIEIKDVEMDLEQDGEIEATEEWTEEVFSLTKSESIAIVFGNLIPSIDDSIEDGVFNLRHMVTRIQNSLTGTVIDRAFGLSEVDMELEELSIEKLSEMKEARDRDGTYSIFIEDPSKLPDGVRSYLINSRALQFLREDGLIQWWKPRAQHLVELENSREANQELTERVDNAKSGKPDKSVFSLDQQIIFEELRKKYESGDI